MEADLGLDALPTHADLGTARIVRRPGHVLLELCAHGAFDPEDPAHPHTIRRLHAVVPALFPDPEPPPPAIAAALAGPSSEAVLAPVLGRTLVSASLLQYHRDATPLFPGQGPVELAFEGGTVVQAARRRHSVALHPLDGAPLGHALRRVHMARRPDSPSGDAIGWELVFSDHTTLRIANVMLGFQAHLAIDQPRRTMALQPDYGLTWTELAP